MLRVNQLSGFGVRIAAIPDTVAFQTSSTRETESLVQGSTTLTLPAGIQAGDLIVVLDVVMGNTVPSAVTPSGFTLALNTSFSNTTSVRSVLLYKIAAGTESSTNITLMTARVDDNGDPPVQGECAVRIAAVFRGSSAITGVTVASTNAQGTSGNPTAQTVTASGGTPPLIVFGVYEDAVVNNGEIAGAVGTRTMSPAKDAEITTASTGVYLAYKIYNETPVDVSVDMNDEGNVNMLQSLYMALTLA